MGIWVVRRSAGAVVTLAALLLLSPAFAAAAAPPESRPPTVEEARVFLEQAEAQLLTLAVKAERAAWVQNNFITYDTELMAAQALQEVNAAGMKLAAEATRFDGLDLPEDLARKLKLLKLATIPLPLPRDPALQTELTQQATAMESLYGKGEYCPEGKDAKCLDLNALEKIMAESRDPKELLDAWEGWRKVSVPMRARYQRFVELANQGARDLGFADLGAMWRSDYDMTPDQFAAEEERLWQQLRPLYLSLHAYVRWRLAEKYGPDVVPPDGLIPADLLGNMWAQSWVNIYPLVAPPASNPGYDLTERLKAEGYDARKMVRTGEHFFTSLGFDPLPETFWERSLFTKPRDRDVVCHASAWDVDADQDLRIKMCIRVNGEDFSTVHHELGHNFYQRAYRHQPPLFRDSANDGFHEALGDTIALSVTPDYLKKIGLIDQVPPADADIGLLMKMALDKIAFLPFALVVDQWRWGVFSGQIPPSRYNQAWWELREKYQGIAPPVKRSEADFDPGAKFHVAANYPYARYFLADVLEFQFHRALCREIGYQGPLNRCSIYDNKAAGARLQKMMAMGKSRPWPEALAALTGEKQMDATAILDYFAPLKKWLDEQNRGHKVGF